MRLVFELTRCCSKVSLMHIFQFVIVILASLNLYFSLVTFWESDEYKRDFSDVQIEQAQLLEKQQQLSASLLEFRNSMAQQDPSSLDADSMPINATANAMALELYRTQQQLQIFALRQAKVGQSLFSLYLLYFLVFVTVSLIPFTLYRVYWRWYKANSEAQIIAPGSNNV
jgi:hypothetical protein